MTLSRNTPLKRAGFGPRKSPMSRGRAAPLRASRWGIAPSKKNKRATSARNNTPYRRFVRTLDCINCGRFAPSDPAHVATGPGQKGTSLKVDDMQCVPLCRGPEGCHRYFDGNADGPRNPFRDWTKEQKYERARAWVEATQFAATPGDSRDAALELERLGLGRIIGNGTPGGWAWLPGSLTEAGAGELERAVGRVGT